MGTRTAFYEATGAYRDMVVTHLFQILAFMEMDSRRPPCCQGRSARKRTRSSGLHVAGVEPKDVVAGAICRKLPGRGRRRPREVDTETFIALKCSIERIGAEGVACRLSCAPARRWPRGSGLFPSLSARACPRACFLQSGKGAYGLDHLTFDLADACGVGVMSFLRQTPWPRYAAGQAEHAVRAERDGYDRRGARGL